MAISPWRRASAAPRQWCLPALKVRCGLGSRVMSNRSGSRRASPSRLAAASKINRCSPAAIGQPAGIRIGRFCHPVNPEGLRLTGTELRCSGGGEARDVDDYIDALPEPLRAVAEHARHVIDAVLEDADSAIRWAHPTWSLDKQPVCYLKAASKHITFGFWHGASIDDRSGRLESSGVVMAHVKLRDEHDVDPELFADWIKQARAIELDYREQG